MNNQISKKILIAEEAYKNKDYLTSYSLYKKIYRESQAHQIIARLVDIAFITLKKTNTKLEIISGQEEAKLIFSNFHIATIDKGADYILIDVGGGSTELSLIKRGKKIASKSFKLGSVRQLSGTDVVSVKLQMKNWIENHIPNNNIITAMGTGGSINKIYNLSQNKPQAPLSFDELSNTLNLIKSYNYEQRIRILKLKPDRADVIIPSGEIYKLVMECTKAEKIIVPKVGLSDV